jgi:hypothetical protein
MDRVGQTFGEDRMTLADQSGARIKRRRDFDFERIEQNAEIGSLDQIGVREAAPERGQPQLGRARPRS